MPTTALVVGGVLVAVLVGGLLLALLRALGTTTATIETLTARLATVEERTGRFQRELAAIDDGLEDVAAALREHRPVDEDLAPEPGSAGTNIDLET